MDIRHLQCLFWTLLTFCISSCGLVIDLAPEEEAVLESNCNNLEVEEDSSFSCKPSIAEHMSSGEIKVEATEGCKWVEVNQDTYEISGRPQNGHVGSCEVTLSGESHGKLYVSNLNFQIKNKQPSLEIETSPVVIQDSSLFELLEDNDVRADDENQGSTIYSFDHNTTTAPRCFDHTAELSLDTSTGAVQFQPAVSYAGTCNVKIQFDDGNGESVSQEFSVTVSPLTTNPPLLGNILDQTITEGSPLTTIDAYDQNTWDDIDIDGETVNYTCYYDTSVDGSVSDTNTCASLGGITNSWTASTGVWDWTPNSSQAGVYEIKITGTDIVSLFDFKIFNITVNDNPIPAAATSLAWSNTSPSNTTALEGTWAKSSSGSLTNQDVLIYNDSTCTNLLQTQASVGTSAQTFNYTGADLTDYTFKVRSYNSLGEYSDSGCSPSVYVDTTAPIISINSGAVFTKQSAISVNLKPTSGYATEVYLTEDAGCGSGGVWQPFSATLPFTLTNLNTTAVVYYKYRTSTLVESACVNDTIIHDDLGPSAVTGLSLSSATSTIYATPSISWSAATDPNGISSYQAQIHLDSDDSVVYPWTPLSSGNPLISLYLTVSENYYIKVRAIDSAGNFGAEAQSSIFTATAGSAFLAWGSNTYGELGLGYAGNTLLYEFTEVPNGSSFTEIMARCGLTSTGNMYCWGQNADGALGQGTPYNQHNFTPTQVGTNTYDSFFSRSVISSHGNQTQVCAIDSSQDLYCWGKSTGGNAYGVPTQILPGTKFTKVTGDSLNWAFAALGTDNNIYYWGWDNYGAAGQGGTGGNYAGVNPSGGLQFKDVYSTEYNTCGITLDDKLYCWGYFVKPDGSSSYVPHEVLPGTPIEAVYLDESAGRLCASSATLTYCWGSYPGNGSTSSNAPVSTGYKFEKLFISGGALARGCGLSGNKIYCWGRTLTTNYSLGDGLGTVSRLSPHLIASSEDFVDLAPAWGGYCGISTTAKLICWGQSDVLSPMYGPTPTTIATNAKSLKSYDGMTTCYENYSDQVFCLGTSAVIPSPNQSAHYNPVTPIVMNNMLDVSPGNYSTCYLDTSGDIYCMGQGFSEMPQLVPGGLNFTQVSTGYEYACGLADDDRIYCWGTNDQGQLGTGDTTPSSTPVAINTGVQFKKVIVGHDTARASCGISLSDDLYCWGRGYPYGGNTYSPTLISGGVKWKELSIMENSGTTFCGIALSGSPYCFGSNRYGGFGNSRAQVSSNSPIQTPAGLNLISVAGFSNMPDFWAIDSNNDVVSWTDTVDTYPGIKFIEIADTINATCGIELGTNFLWCTGSKMNATGFASHPDWNLSNFTNVLPGYTFQHIRGGYNHFIAW